MLEMMYNTPTVSPINNPRVRMLLNIGIGIAALLCAWSVFLYLAGYGTATIGTLPARAVVRVNGNLTTAKTLRLRPGTYTLLVTSPLTNPYQSTFRVSVLAATRINPSLQRRSPDAIASSVVGGIGPTEPVALQHAQWFDSDTWVVGFTLPANAPLALHYDTTQGKWSVTYSTAAGYPSDKTKLPAEISNYITQLETTYVPG